MKLPESKIESAASTEASRDTLQAVKLDVEGKRMLATDGYILAVVPVEVSPEDHTQLISLDTMKQLRSLQKQAKVPLDVRVNSHVTAEWGGQKIEHAPVTGQFPNIDRVIPKEVPQSSTVNLDIDLLMRLADVLKPKETSKFASKRKRILRLHITDRSSAVLVKVNGTEAYGVIMSYGD